MIIILKTFKKLFQIMKKKFNSGQSCHLNEINELVFHLKIYLNSIWYYNYNSQLITYLKNKNNKIILLNLTMDMENFNNVNFLENY